LRVLLDEQLDWQLRRSFGEGFEVETVSWRGWKGKKNGELLALMEEAGWLSGAATTAPVLVANFPEVGPATAFGLAARLRASGIGAEVFPDAIQLGKQLGYGSAHGHKVAVIVGPDERDRKVFNLRDLVTRKEVRAIPFDDLEKAVAGALGAAAGEGS